MFSMLDNNRSADSKIKPKRSIKRWRRHDIHKEAISCFCLTLFAIVLATQIGSSFAQDETTASPQDDNNTNAASAADLGEWREGYSGHGTTHEQLGQPHWSAVEFTPYKSKTTYSQAPISSDLALKPVFNFSRFIFDAMVTDSPGLPPGYVVLKDNDTLALGPKVEENDWADLLAKYWLVLLWILFLLIIIIIVPFIAVCYCCFCCCRRCKQGCPPCDERRDSRRRLCCGICLVVLILLLLLALLIAFFSNRLLDRGLQDSTNTIRRGSEDTCLFMKDVADNIRHLLVYNYEELENHMIDQLNNAHKHLFLDLADTSESNALTELERILDNMPRALLLMRQVEQLEKELRFIASQLRDSIRGMKRDINYAASNLCGTDHCIRVVRDIDVEFIDTSICLHLDGLPNTTLYVEGIEAIMRKKHYEIPKRGLTRLLEINTKVQKQMEQVAPPLVLKIKKGSEGFLEQANKIGGIVNTVLSDLHVNTLHSTKSFEDVYENFGTGRDLVNILVCMSLLMVLIILIIALSCGCIGPAPTVSGMGFCSRGTGAMCLLFVILLIFCVVSFILLVGVFYFMMGLVTYEGACASLRDSSKNSLFRQLDSTVDLNMYRAPSTEDEDQGKVPAYRLTNAIKGCTANKTIFEILRQHNMYDINDLTRLNLLDFDENNDEDHELFEEDLSKTIILTPEERKELMDMREANLSSYHSTLYTSNMCSKFIPMSLNSLAEHLRQLSTELSSEYESAIYAFYNEYKHAGAYNDRFYEKLKNIHYRMVTKLIEIDKSITYDNFDFAGSINVLVSAVERAEKFIQDRGKQFINTVAKNLTQTMVEHSEKYVDMVIREVNGNVGRCDPLAYIYDRGVDYICHRMVDPINGLWVGALLGGLLLLPILLIAHRLMCLYKKIMPEPVAAAAVAEGGCPVCTGAPYVPPAVITCSGGQQAYCECSPTTGPKRGGGGGGGQTETARSTIVANSRTAEITEYQIYAESQSKSKQD